MSERNVSSIYVEALNRLDVDDQKAIAEYSLAVEIVHEEHPDFDIEQIAAKAEELVPEAYQAYSKLLDVTETIGHGWPK